MKKNVLRIVAMCLVLAMMPAIAVSAHPFVDVPVGCWYDEAVQYVHENGLMNGTSATTFSPNETMTRAMIVTVLYRMNGSPAVNKNIPFGDVNKNSFYYNAVCWAYQNGITNGVSATQFAPFESVTRTQMVTMFYRCYGNGYEATNSDLSQYVDANQVPSYARDAFAWAISNNILNGTSTTTLTPNGASSRAQCAVVIQRLSKTVTLTPPKEIELKLDQAYVEMFVGDTLTLNVTYNGDKPLTWTSSADVIASVNNGVVTAHDKGTAYITVSDGDKNATCKIKTNYLGSITIIPPRGSIVAGNTYLFQTSISGNVGSLTWKSLNEQVATVNQNGMVTAIAEGNGSVYVTDGRVEAFCSFRVKAAQVLTEEIVIVNTDGPFYDGVTRYKGDYVELTLANLPNEATQEVCASSSNTEIVTTSVVYVNGGFCEVTLNFKAAGTATITLTSGDGTVSQSYTITVKDGYDFDPGDRQLTPQEFADYITKVMCANGFTYDTGCTSWRQLTLTKDELNFNEAVEHAYNYIHSWWPNGCRSCQIIYIGQDDNGDYVFHTCWG